ncbi:uncharacterized protein [Parasteatoda tepidariorum]|uniref:uncharacterized protein isoform X3 n=1 Tax=Parasteatoda tepidariorum TaxID=114398 RepID=UPI0039BCC21A
MRCVSSNECPKKMWKQVILLCVLITVVNAIACGNYCATHKCPKLQCKKGQIVMKRGSFCGCCNTCYTVLKEGQSCSTLHFRGGPPPTSGCDKGLECDPETNKCA